SGLLAAYSLRIDISPGISCSASCISLRPKSARLRSATLYGCRPAAFAASNACCFFSITVAITYSPFLLFRQSRQTGRDLSHARRVPAEPLESSETPPLRTSGRLDLPRTRARRGPSAGDSCRDRAAACRRAGNVLPV